MKRFITTFAAAALWIVAVLPLGAKVRLAPLFTDNMVLQQKCDAPVFGSAEPGAEITVKVSWDKKALYRTTAGEDGKWSVSVRTLKAGGPYSMTVSDGEETRLDNILFGEVWLCSGQSNMEMPLEGWGKIQNYKEEIRNANYPQIRLFQAKHVTASTPRDELPNSFDGWAECSPETIPTFSATAYFFGRKIHLDEKVPVGLIHSSWGGTFIEPWIRAGAFKGIPSLEEKVRVLNEYGTENSSMKAKYLELLGKWEAEMQSTEGFDNGQAVYAENGFDDSSWKSQNVPGKFQTVLPGFNGVVWFRKEVEIPQDWVGKELSLNLPAVDDNDFTYFNGRLIGKSSGYNIERKYTVPADDVKPGKAVIAVFVIDTGGDGGIIGNAQKLYIACGSEKIPLSGEWKLKETIPKAKIPARPLDITSKPNYPTLLYNAMIHPLIPYAIKGAIWYQGCNNVGHAQSYGELLPLLIADWRNLWGYDFPFYIVQLANYKEPQKGPENKSDWAELREAQEKTSRCVENSGLAVLIDIGEAWDIHPKNKQEVGRRLALQALNKTYGHGKLVCDGPMFERYEIEGSKIRLYFSHCEKGLKFIDGKPAGFVIAGADHNFHWADAVIEGDTIVVSSPEVEMPLAARYAWANNPVISLYNSTDLPASPFRTDNWK